MGFYVYLAQVQSGAVKLGWTARDPRARVYELRFRGQRAWLVTFLELSNRWDCLRVEKALHATLTPVRIEGEWYEPSQAIVALAQEWSRFGQVNTIQEAA